MTLSAGALPTDSFGYRSDGGYAPGTGVLPIQLGTPSNDTTVGAGNQQSAPVVMQVAAGQQISPADGVKATYSASITALASVASATDIFTITGSATKTIRVTRLIVSGQQTTAAAAQVVIAKRSAADTGGTSTTPTAVPHDSGSAAASATINAYTANPTTGALVGNVCAEYVFLAAPATATVKSEKLILDYGNRPAQAIVLRGIAQVLAVNLNGVTVTGGAFDVNIEWTEE